MSTKFHSLNISSVEKLTAEAIVLTFDVPTDLVEEYRYIQGQHLTLKADINGQDVRRSYSICSGVNEQKLQVAIKRIDDGLFSNYANDNLAQGMSIEVMPPQGHFYTELLSTNNKNYLFIATGSGITPVLSNIQSIFEIEPQSSVTLVYGNKTSSLMMFKEKLSFIKNENLEKFNWINCFSQEENDAEILNGRINTEKLLALHQHNIIDDLPFDEVFLCGAESMINELKDLFKSKKYTESQIHYELFFAGETTQNMENKQKDRAKKYTGKVSSVSVKVSGRKTVMELPIDGMNILDAAMQNGADLPFSCKGGVCATCKAKVIKGKVEMDQNYSLTDDEVKAGMILTCQSHPTSDEVEIDFDFA